MRTHFAAVSVLYNIAHAYASLKSTNKLTENEMVSIDFLRLCLSMLEALYPTEHSRSLSNPYKVVFS